MLAAAQACEADVFLDAYGNTSEQWRDEYGPYDHASAFVALLDSCGDAVASARLILPSPSGLKSLVDVESEPWFADANSSARSAGMVAGQTCDIATVAVRRNVASAGVLSAALYHGLFSAMRANQFRWAVMIIDARARRLLSMLNLEGQVIPGTRPAPYLGSSVSVPLWADVPHLMELQRKRNPDAHRLIESGVGLDAIALIDLADFVIRPRGLEPVDDFVPRSGESPPLRARSA